MIQTCIRGIRRRDWHLEFFHLVFIEHPLYTKHYIRGHEKKGVKEAAKVFSLINTERLPGSDPRKTAGIAGVLRFLLFLSVGDRNHLGQIMFETPIGELNRDDKSLHMEVEHGKSCAPLWIK